MRIKGELLKLGIAVSATTIANVLRQGGLGPAPRRIGPTWGEFLRAQALAFVPTGTSASDLEDRARHQSGPAPGPREATGRLAFVDRCRSDEAPAASDPPGDSKPTREEPFFSRLYGRSPNRGAHRLPPSGARPRDGPIPAHLRLIALPEHGRFAGLRTSARPTARWLPLSARAPLIAPYWRRLDSAAVIRRSIPPPDRILVPNRLTTKEDHRGRGRDLLIAAMNNRSRRRRRGLPTWRLRTINGSLCLGHQARPPRTRRSATAPAPPTVIR